jgi:hypothetical protein
LTTDWAGPKVAASVPGGKFSGKLPSMQKIDCLNEHFARENWECRE